MYNVLISLPFKIHSSKQVASRSNLWPSWHNVVMSSCTCSHVPGPPTFKCATLKAGNRPGNEAKYKMQSGTVCIFITSCSQDHQYRA